MIASTVDLRISIATLTSAENDDSFACLGRFTEPFPFCHWPLLSLDDEGDVMLCRLIKQLPRRSLLHD